MRVEGVGRPDRLHGIVHHADGDPVRRAVVVHGANADAFDGLVWELCHGLARCGVTAAAVNLTDRGMGRYADSLRRFSGWSWADLARSVSEVVELAGIAQDGHPVDLIGHSWGALLAAEAAPVVRPDRLILLSPMGSTRAMVDELYPHREFVGLGEEDLAPRSSPPFLSVRTARAFRDRDRRLTELLKGHDGQVEVIVGSREHPGLVASGRAIRSARFTEIEGAGHFYVGRRQQLIEAIRR